MSKVKQDRTFQMRLEHDTTLAYVARQLAILQASMLKEQQKLEAMVNEKSRSLEAMAVENERLRRQNKKLVAKQFSSDQDTTSSGDSSAKSSFSSKSSALETRPPPLPLEQASAVSPRPVGPKPPVPSRAGINKLLMQQTTSPTQPPPPPVRSTSLGLERADSGRESDLTTSDVEPNARRQPSAHDEGFCSSHEDSSGSGGSNGGRSHRINHRNVQKPSDIKQRSKSKSSSSLANLGVLEEHRVTETDPSVTTVTYWTGSFL